MKKENMTPEEIADFNAKVDYNHSAMGWIVDIVTTLIACPMIVLHIYRRCKYRNKIED